MSDTTTLLYRFLGIDDGAGATFDKMAGKTALLGDSSKSALSKVKLLAAGVGVGGIAIGIASIKMASDFQRSMLLIQTQAGASHAEVQKFSSAILAMAGPVGTAPEQLATSLYHVYSTGLKGAKALEAVRIAAEGAKIGHADLEETTNALTASIASGIKGVQNYGQAMGALNAIVGSGDMKLSDLNDALGTGILTAAKVFNVSLTQAGAALAVFGDNNIRGEDAATKLRMAIQDIAKPAANADKVLAHIGLTSDQLRGALSKGGLTSALEMLSSHMTAAGITAGKVGPFIEAAFTKKAGVGLGILLDQMTRYRQKLDEITQGANGFGSAWAATTHTAAFAFDRLKAEAQAALITLGTHLLPAVTAIATWLGTNLPRAISDLHNALAPTISAIKVGLVGGFHALAAVIVPVVEGIGAVLGYLAKHGVVRDFANTVLALWVAFKGYTLAVAAFKAIDTAIVLTRVRLLELAEAGTLGLGAVGLLMAGFYALGKALGGWIDQGKIAFNVLGSLKDAMVSWKDAIVAADGALNNQVKTSVAASLQANGLADKAKAAGISLNELTNAVTGSNAQLGALMQKWQKSGKLTGDLKVSLLATAGAFNKTAQDGRELVAVQDQGKHATDKLTGSTKANSNAQLAASIQARNLAAQIAQLTTNYQKLVNAELSQMQTQDSFKEGLLQLKQSVDQNGHSLSQNTLKGLQNRDMLIGILQNAEKAAEGSRNYGATLIQNVKQFEQFATKAGFSKTQVQNLLTQMHMMPKQIKTRISLDTSGVADALASLDSQAAAVGGRMAANMRASFRDGMGIHSPSRVFQEFGRQIVAGLRNGLHGIGDIGKALALGLITGWKDGTAKLKDALSTPVQAAMDKLTTVVNNAIKKQQGLLKTAQTNLKNLLSQRAADTANLAGNIASSGGGLGSLFGTDANGNPTVANATSFLTGQAKTIQNFAADLKWGAAHGLSPVLLQQIGDLGAEQGDQVLKQFMSGASSISAANQAEAAIQQYSTSAASQVENAIYAKRVAADRKAIHDNTKALHDLTVAMHKIETRTAKAAAMHLTIDAKTGRPTVDKHFIDDIIKGIREAQRLAGKKLL